MRPPRHYESLALVEGDVPRVGRVEVRGQVLPVHDLQAGRHEPGSEALPLPDAVDAEPRQIPVGRCRVGFLHLTEYPKQVIERVGVDGGLEQGDRGFTAGFDAWRQPESDRGEVTQSPDTAVAEGDSTKACNAAGKCLRYWLASG